MSFLPKGSFSINKVISFKTRPIVVARLLNTNNIALINRNIAVKAVINGVLIIPNEAAAVAVNFLNSAFNKLRLFAIS